MAEGHKEGKEEDDQEAEEAEGRRKDHHHASRSAATAEVKVTTPGSVSDVFVSSLDIFPTILSAASIELNETSYVIDGKDMTPVLKGQDSSQHEVFFHYCGFEIISARVHGRFKVFWAKQKWKE